MDIKQRLSVRSEVFKEHVNKYALLGLVISISSILVASMLVSYQLTGRISLSGFILAQLSNPAIWALDLTPFMFAYWGQLFCYELASKAESILENKTREFINKSDDLEHKLEYESQHDSLTHLPNERLLATRIKQGIQQINTDEELALIILNITNFKEINYNFGTFSGNSLLVQFSEKLKSILLEPYMLQAYMGMNMIARIQGSEFAILIPRFKKEHHFERLLKKILDETSTTFMIDGNAIEIKTSLGAVLYPHHGSNEKELIHNASLCLFHAKKESGYCNIYDPSMNVHHETRQTILKALTLAIQEETIDLLYMPVYDLNTHEIIEIETMINFEHPEYDIHSEDQLISLIDNTAITRDLTRFLFKKAARQLALWHQHNHKYSMTVKLLNVADTSFPSFIEQTLKEFGLSSEYLNVELTEEVCLKEQAESSKILKKLSSMGIKIIISDFGSGYASFIYLTNFPVSELKINQFFVINLLKDDKKYRIVKAIIQLANAMEISVVAEGISDQATFNELKKLGCSRGCGPYLSKSYSAEAFESFIQKEKN